VPEILKATQAAIHQAGRKVFVVAVDCPSGVDCDTGETAPNCIHADLTACMAAVKGGLLRMPAFGLLGDLRMVDIGLPANFPPLKAIARAVIDKDFVRAVLPERPPDAHKGTFGTALIVAGSREYTGAAWLAGKAAYRIGAGLVTIGVPESIHAALAGHLPEATWLLLPEKDGGIDAAAVEILQANLNRANALLLGPGFGMREGTAKFLEELIEGAAKLPPTVIDADGLKLLSKITKWPKKLPADSILTPHPGEMAVLSGMSKDEIQASRVEVAEQYAKGWGHVVVLKGAFTVIASPEGRVGVIPVASPALARAGTGDVLAGMMAGLLAQGAAPFEAACAGAWLHAQTGLAAAHMRNPASVLAGELIEEIPLVLNSLKA
jgi:NAD(P)H-hydrate epimerase